MLSDVWAAPIFFGIKYGAVVLYCYAGEKWFRKSAASWRDAAGLGALRMVLGWGIGMALFSLLGILHTGYDKVAFPHLFGSWIPSYVLSFGLLRTLEWALIAWLIARPNPLTRGALFWVLGGVALSFATDWIGIGTALHAIGGIC